MNNKHFLLIFLFFAIASTGFSQVSFLYGPEVGFSSADIHRSRGLTSDQGKVSTVPKPIVGISTELIFANHFRLGLGLQYENINQYYHLYNTWNVGNYSNAVVASQNNAFQKVCLPVSAGYVFSIGKFRAAVFAGMRPNYFLNGEYNYSCEQSYDTTKVITVESYNPLDRKNALPQKTFGLQFFGGISVSFQRFEIAACYNRGRSFDFSKDAVYFMMCEVPPPHANFFNNDYTITLKYNFGKLPKVKTSIDECFKNNR